jgi:hypothetical protein
MAMVLAEQSCPPLFALLLVLQFAGGDHTDPMTFPPARVTVVMSPAMPALSRLPAPLVSIPTRRMDRPMSAFGSKRDAGKPVLPNMSLMPKPWIIWSG